MERDQGLEISLNCDRFTTFQDDMSLKFIDIIVFPYFAEIVELLPETYFMIEGLKSNRKQWHDQLLTRLAKDPIEQASNIVDCKGKATAFDKDVDRCVKLAKDALAAKSRRRPSTSAASSGAASPS
jgi:hypothetical protein